MERKLTSHKAHLNFSAKISQNLLGSCDLFVEGNSFLPYLEKEVSKFHYGYELTREKVLKFKELVFYEIFFTTSPKNESSIKSTTTGYMVEHIGSRKCYGVI